MIGKLKKGEILIERKDFKILTGALLSPKPIRLKILFYIHLTFQIFGK